MHAWGLRLRGVLRVLALTHSPVLPSAMLNDVDTPVAIISQLNTLPACTPANASIAASRPTTHDSGPGWIATPFPYDSFIHNSTPVYPGALSTLLGDFLRLTAEKTDALIDHIELYKPVNFAIADNPQRFAAAADYFDLLTQ